MSRTIARLMLSMLVLPASVLVGVITGIITEYSFGFGYRNLQATFVIAACVAACFITAAWMLIWWGQFKWDLRRALLVASSVAGAVTLSIGTRSLLNWTTGDPEPSTIFGTLTGVIAFLAGLIFAWRETPAERAKRLAAAGAAAIACPNCGYNLTGLKQTNCPECGSVFTIEQLVAAKREETNPDAAL